MKPILILPSLSPDGSLLWRIRSEDKIVTLVADTGDIYLHNGKIDTEVLTALVGALREWYQNDVEEFDGLNLLKVKSELDNKE